MTRLTKGTLEIVEAIGTATRDEATAARCAQITLTLMAGGMPPVYEDALKEMFG